MIKFKNTYFLLLLLVFTNCSKDFLETEPLDAFNDALIWDDPALSEAFLNDVYLNARYGFSPVMMASLTDESMDTWGWGDTGPVVTSTMTNASLGTWHGWTAYGSLEELTWYNFYRQIRACNKFLLEAETSKMQKDDLARLKGEALFLRAYNYSFLMKLFGGVPLLDKPQTLDDDLLVSRATFEETVNFIVADLDEAASLLKTGGDKARASKGAALTLKSRVLLYAASDLFNSGASYAGGYATPELVSYIGGDRTARWQAARDAAKAVIDLGAYSLYEANPANTQQAVDNLVNMWLTTENVEDIWVTFWDNVNANIWNKANPGLFTGPNGWECWGGNTPLGQLADDYEMNDGSKFDWGVNGTNPYTNRDPRFYANILYDGAQWQQRPASTYGLDPDGILQTGVFEQADGSFVDGLDTRKGPVQDWNGTNTSYYSRKFIDPGFVHTPSDRQEYPWRQMRYAEVLLNYAEACIELGDETEAKTYLNMIRKRAGMPNVPLAETGTALLERCRNERRIELSFEEHRYFDIRRWMIAPAVMTDAQGVDIVHNFSGTVTYTLKPSVQLRGWDNKAYFLPIHFDDLNANENLKQNPGY